MNKFVAEVFLILLSLFCIVFFLHAFGVISITTSTGAAYVVSEVSGYFFIGLTVFVAIGLLMSHFFERVIKLIKEIKEKEFKFVINLQLPSEVEGNKPDVKKDGPFKFDDK
jgi:hypothetical protein